ncbi:hypothetical protein J2T57_001632 [Natronocella acetinitrilica]|uniref:Uncharacterized protein n=1 Tax=Natronocella acetinitrilica TaxID=414046 RepID=A0AAE3G2B9_9GAMM|nr:hypothetical protein [Natronocella acetinitrilica]MCP1674530.1 hypothetical protein [Natronocella acetinitrilica]
MAEEVTYSGSEANRALGLKDITLTRSHDALDHMDEHLGVTPDGRVVLSYLAHDDDPMDYEWDRACQGRFEEFRSAQARDERLLELQRDGTLVFLVERYAHGNVHYSVAGTRNYPDRQWDVAQCAIYIPPDDEQAAFTLGRNNEYVLRTYANQRLSEYSKWRNGEVYAVVVETFERDERGEFRNIDTDAVWGHIGGDYAESELRARHAIAVSAPPPAPPAPQGLSPS